MIATELLCHCFNSHIPEERLQIISYSDMPALITLVHVGPIKE
jgi:hypothetical protein